MDELNENGAKAPIRHTDDIMHEVLDSLFFAYNQIDWENQKFSVRVVAKQKIEKSLNKFGYLDSINDLR